MTGVTQKTSYDVGAQFEDGMSVPPEAPKPGQPAATAAAPEKKDEDSFGLVDTVKSFFGVEKPAAKKTEAKYGPNNLPKPPPEPRNRTIMTSGLTGETLERVKEHNAKVWGEYEAAYKQYLNDFREAYKNCGTLEQLRQMQPEPPTDTLSKVGYDASDTKLDREYRQMFTEKVDRGYELIGKAPPGTLTAIFGASVSGRVLAAGKSVDHKYQLDSRGEAKHKVVTSNSLEASGVKLAQQSDGKQSVSIGVSGFKAKQTIGGETEISVGFDKVASGTASYNPNEATFGGGVKIAPKLDLGVAAASVELSVKAQLKGMSPEDVDRALRGWLVPQPEDVNAKWLKEQQLKANCSR